MALFNFLKKQAFEDFNNDISSGELLQRLKNIYYNVNDLGDNCICIEDLAINLWHEKGGCFILESRFEIPDFMQNLSDANIISCCNDINNQRLLTCYFCRTDDSTRVLAFRNTEFFIRNITEINRNAIALADCIHSIYDELKERYKKSENNLTMGR